MIDFYYAGTPNGVKVRLFLEEAQLPYRLVPVRLSRGEQHKPEFLAISPNNKIPAIVDHARRATAVRRSRCSNRERYRSTSPRRAAG